MSELYKKLEVYRDQNRTSINYKYAKSVLNQLLIIGFHNETTPNELPVVFTIDMVHFNEADFEDLMLNIGYKVKAYMKFGCYDTKLYTYEVHIIYKK